MRIVTLCATRRGYLFIQKLTELLPEIELIVFSFREEPWEPPFLDDIHRLTMTHNGQFFEAKQVGSQRWRHFWETTEIDLMFAISWRYMIPPRVYNKPKLGTFVCHDSLLPQYRGFAPTVWAMINGEDHTGVTLFEIAEGVDEGDIIAQKRIPIGSDDTIAQIIDQVTQSYLDLLEENLGNLLAGTAPRYPQEHSQATYTCKLTPEDVQINWSSSTEQVYNLIRAYGRPYSGAYTFLSGQKLRIWSARRVDQPRHYISRLPGRVVEVRPDEGSIILTGDGLLLVKEVQLENSEPMCASKVLNKLSTTL